MAQASHRTTLMKLKDLLLYCVIGVLVAGTAMLLGIYRARARLSPGLSVKWLGFAIMTAFVFGNAIRYSRPAWGSPKFWMLLVLFSILHFGLGFLVVSKLANVGLIHFALATPVEYFALTACLGQLLNHNKG